MSDSKTVTIFRMPESARQDEPDGWLLFNAPRPLYGHREWRGDFVHGVFYAAVNPRGERAEWMICENAKLDGWVIRYYGEAEILEHAQHTADKYGYTLDRLMGLATMKDVEASWRLAHGKEELLLDEFLEGAKA